MSASEIVSLVTGVVAIVIAVCSLAYAARQARRRRGIQLIPHSRYGLNLLISSQPEWLCVMGVTLRSFLVADTFRLHISLTPDIRVRILLLNPYVVASLKMAQRERELSDIASFVGSDYLRERLAILDYARHMCADMSNVEVRLYDQFPMGSLFISDKACIYSPYVSFEFRQLSHARNAFLVRREAPDSTAFYAQLLQTFEAIWTGAVPLAEDPRSASLNELMQIEGALGVVSAYKPVILGAGDSGAKIIKLFIGMKKRIRGVYDRDINQPGIHEAMKYGIPVYVGWPHGLEQLLEECSSQPEQAYCFFVVAEHERLVAAVKARYNSRRLNNWILLKKAVDFPRDFDENDLKNALGKCKISE